ncbi:MAG: DUF2237 family protein [Granulosicoccus sp.]
MQAKNIFGEDLVPCGMDPITGFYRDGCCDTGPEDRGSHTVCVAVTDEFLSYTRSVGNDLSTPLPAHGFPGLKEGDRWCLCASRWLQAYEAGKAPRVYVRSTHIAALKIISMKLLTSMAADLN